MTPEVAVGAVVVHDGRLLLVQRRNDPEAGRWSVPGGRVRGGEPLWEAVVREVREETGLEVAVDRFLGWVERIGSAHHFVILDFAATALEGHAGTRPVAGDDATDARWVALEDVAEHDLVEGLAEFLADTGIIDPARAFRL